MSTHCSRCKVPLSSENGRYRKNSKEFESWCRSCRRESNRKYRTSRSDHYNEVSRLWRIKNQERLREYQRIRNLRRNGLTVEAYESLLSAQGGVCAICKEPPGEKSLHIDHDHTCCPYDRWRGCCGKCVRGLLCDRCNLGVGYFRDEPRLLRDAAEYVETHR